METEKKLPVAFPNQLISVQINISLPAYYPLQNIGGWVYISEQQSGTKGYHLPELLQLVLKFMTEMRHTFALIPIQH